MPADDVKMGESGRVYHAMIFENDFIGDDRDKRRNGENKLLCHRWVREKNIGNVSQMVCVYAYVCLRVCV
jgi:hypothetical protein